MESNCSSHCEMKLPCYAQCRCQKHIELTVQHPGAAKDSGFQLWSSHEQNKLHKLVKAARASQVMVREPEPSCWMTTRDVRTLYVQQWVVFNLSCVLPAACSSCYCSVFQLGNKKADMYWLCFCYSWAVGETQLGFSWDRLRLSAQFLISG